MKRNTKGFYTLEAAVFLPFVILAVLSLGYFMRIEGMWENCIHGAVDESTVIAAKACNGMEPAMTGIKVKQRIEEDEPDLDFVEIKSLRTMYSDFRNDSLISYRIEASETISFPLAFEHEFRFENKIKFRGFVGKRQRGSPLGAEGLETDTKQEPVWIFPYSGEKYHSENCTYVKAAVHPVILTGTVKSKYGDCSLCRSKEMPAGSIVYCFDSKDTAYHRGTCSAVTKRTAVIDKTEAVKRGYAPCSKCGG